MKYSCYKRILCTKFTEFQNWLWKSFGIPVSQNVSKYKKEKLQFLPMTSSWKLTFPEKLLQCLIALQNKMGVRILTPSSSLFLLA